MPGVRPAPQYGGGNPFAAMAPVPEIDPSSLNAYVKSQKQAHENTDKTIVYHMIKLDWDIIKCILSPTL